MPEIEVKLVTDSVKFVAVNTETKTETETETDYKVSFSKSFWSDNVWNSTKDEPIKPGVVRNFIEWDTQQGGEYAGTYNETAEVTISAIEIKDLDKYVSKYGVPPKDAKLVIPEGGIKVTVDLGYAVEENPEWNNPYCYDLGCDPDSVSYYPDPSNDGSVNGAYEGDTITIVPFNKIVSILDIGDDYFVYGHDYGTAWYKVGDEKTFEDYTFKVLDINIFEQKVLIQFSAPGMETVTESVKVGETYTYGGLHVTVDDAFIGSTQDVIAKLHVKVAGGRVKSGDEKYSLAPGYVTYLDIKEDTDGNKYIDKISFINAESIEGNPIDLFNTYEVKYVYTAEEVPCKKGNDEETKYLVNAKVVIDPYPYYMKQELGLGDMIKGFIIDDVTFSIDPTKAAQPAKVTTPITVLDTEIMEAGLDKVDSNLILVGGPVVNQVTAALADKFGVPTTYEEWAANETLKAGIYKYIDNCPTIGGHGVILVAGADREGTKAAAEALMEYIANLS
nr:S-layer protein [Thermococcus stetteri]